MASADLLETAVAWQQALEHHNGPTLYSYLAKIYLITQSLHTAEQIKRGGYIVTSVRVFQRLS